jgi:tetratricopeptide (TPR) repeat protein
MNIISMVRLGVRVAKWAAPHVQEWHRERNLDRTEGQRHLTARNWSLAEVHLSTALATGQHTSQERVDMLLGLASAQRSQGKLEEAEETARVAAELGVAAGNHGWQMQAQTELLEIHLSQENYAAARDLARSILKQEGSRVRPDKATLATAFRKLGMALAKAGPDSGDAAEAVTALERGAALAEEVWGKDHVETAHSLSELGSFYRSQEKHGDAQRCLRRAVEIHRALSGATSPETTLSLLHLANSLAESGDPDAACSEFERVLKLKEQQVGVNPEETIDVRLNLARLYLEAGRTPAARELLLLTVGNVERKGGQRLITALELLVEAEQIAGRHAEAARWSQKLDAVGKPPSRPDIMAQFGRVSPSY